MKTGGVLWYNAGNKIKRGKVMRRAYYGIYDYLKKIGLKEL